MLRIADRVHRRRRGPQPRLRWRAHM